MGETVAEIDESHFQKKKKKKKSMNLISFKPTFHVVTVKKECGADCRRRYDSILTHPLNMPANLLYRLWGHETVERWYH
uniref:Uncharacterized protein n=1 Tax=Brassica oleracea TaxID=3712 RepID=A0A3P6D3N9_BRAOL|nr:unnamed protein product [Brassica oleracea]